MSEDGKERKTTKRRRRKKGSNQYFTDTTTDYIVRFQAESDQEKKKAIFVEGIRPAFAKLIENLIFVYHFHTAGNIDELKNDCLSFLFENVHKYDHSRGHKAFSYFNVIAKHWFIQRVKDRKKKNKSDVHLDKTLLSKLEKANNQAVVMSFEDDLLKSEFIILLKQEIKDWRKRFDKEQERKVLEAIILLFTNPDHVSIYNKKGIYLYIREITGLNTKQVVTNLTKFKKKYKRFRDRYLNGEL